MIDGTSALTTSARDDAPLCGDGAKAPARALAECQIEALGELVGIGLKIARAIERQVDEAAAGPQPLADLNAAAVAYARVARAVRQSILLQDRLTEAQQAAEAEAEAGALRARKDGVKARMAGVVRSVIEAEHDDAERIERLAAEAMERLEQDLHGDVLARPVAEIIADICKDLGLHPDWPALALEVSAVEDMASGGDAPEAPEKIEIFWLDDEGRPTPAGRRRDSS
jgi:hypothetical protein